ncbi:T9SS type A sorting domain-containing protein [Tenuifilum osseticum]|uniref:T9SS type A sorting domain-containing protein n=1 Tax=Tenuifilum osseticum TaxID=3374723 RepID=UPI0034E4C23D
MKLLNSNTMRKALNILGFIFVSSLCYGQEVLVNLSGYRTISDVTKKSNYTKTNLSLPFFDDFARNTPYPTPELWEPSNAISNKTYAINPPTIGVATFDAVNRKGVLHQHLTTTPQPADTLTSLPINLNYPATDSIYLSFSVQPGGLGYQPSPNDSLVLELFSPSENRWVRGWASSVDFNANKIAFYNHLLNHKDEKSSTKLDSTFFTVNINIDNPIFLENGFRFRFIGYASLMENATVPGYKTNSDHWHIDMVYLNRLRNWDDTIYNDIAFRKPIKSILKNYTSVPWTHFADAEVSEIKNPREFSIVYNNLGPTTWNVTRRFAVTNLSTGNEYTFSGGAENIYGYEEFTYTRPFDYTFTSAWPDSAKFLLKTFLQTDFDESTKHLRYNDSLVHQLNFYNYYALDDGSAESGYGLFGEGTINAMIAQKFYSYKADNLVGVMIYFNRSYQDANNEPFKISIWADNNGKPGELLYQRSTTRPLFTDSLNCFTVYRTDPVSIPVGNFYIGWQQSTIEFLNVGFDRNTNSRERIFHTLPGYWTNTQFEGTIMIRPIFGKLYQNPTTAPISTTSNIRVYPNPASEKIYIDVGNGIAVNSYQLISITGQVIESKSVYQNEPIDVEHIPTGMYLLKVNLANGQSLTSKVIIKR